MTDRSWSDCYRNRWKKLYLPQIILINIHTRMIPNTCSLLTHAGNRILMVTHMNMDSKKANVDTHVFCMDKLTNTFTLHKLQRSHLYFCLTATCRQLSLSFITLKTHTDRESLSKKAPAVTGFLLPFLFLGGV